jgi:hypothetical protein
MSFIVSELLQGVAKKVVSLLTTENLEGFLCVLGVLRGETIGEAQTIIHSFTP